MRTVEIRHDSTESGLETKDFEATSALKRLGPCLSITNNQSMPIAVFELNEVGGRAVLAV